ncbi:MAG: type II toxin-antitoxin system VapC family toxin [Sphingosinicella sp.]
MLDSNVVIATLAETHEHHMSSIALIKQTASPSYAIAAHSYSEAYLTLTRRDRIGPFRWNANKAWIALEGIAAVTALVGLTPNQAINAVRTFAASGGTGARLYDRLIGEVAVQNRIPRIITWNVKHMRGLFPQLEVVDPRQVVRS